MQRVIYPFRRLFKKTLRFSLFCQTACRRLSLLNATRPQLNSQGDIVLSRLSTIHLNVHLFFFFLSFFSFFFFLLLLSFYFNTTKVTPKILSPSLKMGKKKKIPLHFFCCPISVGDMKGTFIQVEWWCN